MVRTAEGKCAVELCAGEGEEVVGERGEGARASGKSQLRFEKREKSESMSKAGPSNTEFIV